MMHVIIHCFILAAHELRAWLLHYSPVVLYEILPEEFYQHHLLLVEATYLLLQDSIKANEVEQSLLLLQHYCFMFAPLYGMCNQEYIMYIQGNSSIMHSWCNHIK